MLTHWIVIDLALKLAATWPVADPVAHAEAALEASTEELPPDLLLAIARVESRFESTATSRVQGDRRRTGAWRRSQRGIGFSGPYFCGPLQARAETWSRCLELRDLGAGYAAGVAELRRWRRRTGAVSDSLAGHCCGNGGLEAYRRGDAVTSRSTSYVRRVIAARRRLNGQSARASHGS